METPSTADGIGEICWELDAERFSLERVRCFPCWLEKCSRTTTTLVSNLSLNAWVCALVEETRDQLLFQSLTCRRFSMTFFKINVIPSSRSDQQVTFWLDTDEFCNYAFFFIPSYCTWCAVVSGEKCYAFDKLFHYYYFLFQYVLSLYEEKSYIRMFMLILINFASMLFYVRICVCARAGILFVNEYCFCAASHKFIEAIKEPRSDLEGLFSLIVWCLAVNMYIPIRTIAINELFD